MRVFFAVLLGLIMCASPMSLASVSVNVNGTAYTIPQNNEKGWGTSVTAWIQAMSNYTLQPIGGTFTLTNDLSFGSSYGLYSKYYTTNTALPASSGVLRLANLDYIKWRNAANNADIGIQLDGTNVFQLGGNTNINGTFGVTGAVNLSTTLGVTGTSTLAAVNATTATLSSGLTLNSGAAITMNGSGSGTVTIAPQAAAGTYNFNLPITAGTSGYALLSGGGSTSPMTWGAVLTNPAAAAYDMLYQNAGNSALTRLANGTTGQSLIATTGNAPSWGVPASATSATTATNLAGGAGGSIPYQSAAATTAMLANGSSGQALISAGGTSAPAWTTLTAPTQSIATSSSHTGGMSANGSGTYTVPAGVKAVKFILVGGGGAGGGGAATTGSTGSAGGGGGGGGSVIHYVTSPAASYAYVVGAGGTAGTAGNNAGNAGAATTIVSLSLSAGGGAGGSGSSATAGPVFSTSASTGSAGTASGGTLNITGSNGDAGLILGPTGLQGLSGKGGNSLFGFGGIQSQEAGAGNAGTGYGGGGSGGSSGNSGGAIYGGAGSGGILIVEEYYQ